MSRSGAQVQAEPSRVPPASGVIGGRLWPGLSVPVTPCCSSNTYQFVPSRCFLSMNIIPLSEKQIFLFSLYIKGDKGERKEKIHPPPILPVPASAKEPLSECGRGLMSAFSPPGCLSLLF